MSESIKTLLMSALDSNDTPADTDTMIVANGNTLKKTTIAKMVDFWKSKLGINDINTKLGKTAKFYPASAFTEPTDSTYHGMRFGGIAWNDIEGLNFVPDNTNYLHYFTFPEGTYVVTINIFTDTSITSETSAAFKILVDDKTVYNPFFRWKDQYQSLQYTCIVKGKKFQPLINVGKTVQIQAAAERTFVSFIRIA